MLFIRITRLCKTSPKQLAALNWVRMTPFIWVGENSKQIPEEYDSLLSNSHASYYNLSMALKQSIAKCKKLFPPARMIRPTSFVFCNSIKGGVDEFSRAMKSFARTNTAEIHIVSVIKRMATRQVADSGFVHPILLAKSLRKWLIPSTNYSLIREDMWNNVSVLLVISLQMILSEA